jgi:hypothetical protein
MNRKKVLKERVVQKLPYRCPYCDHPISYEQFNMKVGENKIKCPSCKKKYIKVVSDESPPPSPSPIKGEGRRRGPRQRRGNNGFHHQVEIGSFRKFPAIKRNKS